MNGDPLETRWIYVVIGFVGMLFSGASYAWGVFVAPMENQFGLLRAETSLAFTLNIFFYAGGIMVAGWLARFLRFAVIMRIGAILLGTGFVLQAMATNIWLVYLFFSLLCGLGAGLAYNGIVSSVPQWFQEKAGLVTGILLVGYAVSSAVFGPVAVQLMGWLGLAGTFRVIGCLCGCVLLALSFFLRIPTEQEKQLLPAMPARQSVAGERDVPTARMLRSVQFWLLFVILGCFSGVGLIVINHLAPLLAEELAMGAAFASMMVSAVFFCNALGRVCSGWMLDKMGVGATFLAMAVIMLTAMCAAAGGLYIGAAWLVVTACALTLLTFGANASMIPNAVRVLFGQKYFPLNYSMLNANVVWVGFFPTFAGLLHSYYHGYLMLFVYLTGVALLTLGLILYLITTMRKPETGTESEDA